MPDTENENQDQSSTDESQSQSSVTPDNTEDSTAGDQQESTQPTSDDIAKLKAALAKERAAGKNAAKELAALKAAQEAQNKTPEEQALEAARREGETAAEKRANERLVKAELKAAAKGKFKNLADALVFIDVSSIEVGDDGEVDTDALDTAITTVLTERPYLAVEAVEPKRFQGGADQGGDKRAAPKQLTRADLAGMTPQQIVDAEAKGQLVTLYKTGT